MQFAISGTFSLKRGARLVIPRERDGIIISDVSGESVILSYENAMLIKAILNDPVEFARIEAEYERDKQS